MNAGELFEHFRGDIFDTVSPYLWTDDEVWRYELDAYRMFVRLTGGISDFTSEATEVAVVTGESSVALHPSILRIMSAYLESDGTDVAVVSQFKTLGTEDYGMAMRRVNKPMPGPVREMVVGRQQHLAHFTSVPTAADTLRLSIYRLPLVDTLTDSSEFDEIGDEHVIHLTSWMKHLAFKKDDVEVGNTKKSKVYEDEFRRYCDFVKHELTRKSATPRVVAYGGI